MPRITGRTMRTASRLKFLCVAAALCCGLVAAARAVDSAPQPSDPPPLPEHPLPATPAPAPAAADDLQSCLQETGDYVTRGGAVIYAIGITNTCDKRLRCEIFANITGAKGTSLGHTVMTLGPAAGGAAKKSYEFRVKAAGGVAQVSRECRVL
jgi:hypothetical protein